MHPQSISNESSSRARVRARDINVLIAMAGLTHPNPKEFVRSSRGKYRSRTFPELAKAIADQWGNYVLQHI